MGSAWSSYKSKKNEKREYKRQLREQLKEAQEYLARLQDRLQLQSQLLDRFQRSRVAVGLGPEAQADCVTNEMKQEIQALERKLFVEEIALDVTEDRCDSPDNNYSLLQNNETNLQWQRSACKTNLEALKLVYEAIQFRQFKQEHPVEEWIVCSLPNLNL